MFLDMTQPGADYASLSQALWGSSSFFGDQILVQRNRQFGWGMKDDFGNFGLATSAIASSLGYYTSEGNQYRSYEVKAGGSTTQAIIPVPTGSYTVPAGLPINTPNGSTILVPVATVLPTPGQLAFSPTTSSDQAQLQMGGSTAALNSLPFAAIPGTSGNLIFEARFKILNGFAGSTSSWFIGLAGVDSGITSSPVGATAYPTGTSLLGFGNLQTDTAGQIGWVYGKSGGTVQQQGAASMSALNLLTIGSTTLYGGQLTGAAGYLKMGFFFNSNSKTVTPFVNGQPLLNKVITSGVTGACGSTVPAGTGSTTAWPALYMSPATGLFAQTTNTEVVTLDWWACAQETLLRSNP
jgi:hypothetical protein